MDVADLGHRCWPCAVETPEVVLDELSVAMFGVLECTLSIVSSDTFYRLEQLPSLGRP
jgi:hypothetical protein